MEGRSPCRPKELDETELVSPILKTAEWHAGHERHAFLSIRGIPRRFRAGESVCRVQVVRVE
jgi:hypothetical protein